MTEEVALDQTRFKEGKNGVVIEPSKGLVWMKYDTYQLSNKWMSWVQVRDYAEELNKKNMRVTATGVCRIPQKQEACMTKNILIKTTWVNRFLWMRFSPPVFVFYAGRVRLEVKFRLCALDIEEELRLSMMLIERLAVQVGWSGTFLKRTDFCDGI